jgi:C-terminal binding protein
MKMQFRVVVTDLINDPLEPERQVLGDLAEIEALNAADEAELDGRVENADALMLYHHLKITRRTIQRLQRCKIIVRCGVGIDNVDCAAARERGIPVANIPDYGTEEVADSAIGLMLALTRGIAGHDMRLRNAAEPWSYEQGKPLHRLRGREFAIVGLGRIGTATALRAKALGMEVVFHDPYKPDGSEKALGIRRAGSLDELLASAFVLSLHCPLSDETYHLIDGPAIEQMPSGSYLINTARGAVVESAAVVGAVASGRLAGAGIDVLEREPPPPDCPLTAAWRNPDHPAYYRVLINPHAAFYSEEGLLEIRLKGSQACRRALCGQPVPNVVNGVAAPQDAGAPTGNLLLSDEKGRG